MQIYTVNMLRICSPTLLFHFMFQLVCQNSIYPKMFNPSFVMKIPHCCIALTQSFKWWFTSKSYMQDKMKLWRINAFVIVSNTCMYSSSLEKKKVGNSLTTSTWLYEDFRLKWPSFNHSCAWIKSWKNYARRIVCNGLMKFVMTLMMT